MDENKLELKKISMHFTDDQEQQIAAIESRRKDLEKGRNLSFELKGRNERDLDQIEKKVNIVNQKIRELNLLSGGLSELQQSEQIAVKLEKNLQTILQRSETTSFDMLSKLINETLERYAKQDYKAKIDKKFNIHLIDRDGDRVAGESDGQQLLLSLTFISSLIKLAALRKGSPGQILTSGVVAPFVIDAPFGVLDNSYKGSMAKSIPDSVEQVVFLLSSSHWEGSVESSLRDRIGKEYNFVMEVNAPQGEKDLNPLTIKQVKIDTVRYDCSIDRTVIEEVTI